MTEEEIRSHIATNIAHYRRQMNLTQTELSDRINYSDKSVSKWERAEGVPDIYVLSQLAEIFGVGVDDLLAAEPPRRRTGGRKQRLLITLLSTGLVWLCACFAFFLCMLPPSVAGRPLADADPFIELCALWRSDIVSPVRDAALAAAGIVRRNPPAE